MNIKMLLLAVAFIASAVSLSGCASMRNKDTSAMLDTPTRHAVDSAYVSKVNRQASEQGVSVVWVNPPDRVAGN